MKKTLTIRERLKLSDPDPSSTLLKKVEEAALRNASKEDIAKIEQMLKEKPIPSPPVVATTPPATGQTDDQMELEKYRENNRQTLLKELPADLQEKYKEKSLKEVMTVSKVHKSLSKKDVGVNQPPPSSDAPDKKFQWNPLTGKNEFC